MATNYEILKRKHPEIPSQEDLERKEERFPLLSVDEIKALVEEVVYDETLYAPI